MNGYQSAILYLIGSQCGQYFVVRSVDRWYVDAVADLFPGHRPYLQRRNEPDKKDYWCIKGRITKPELSDVPDWVGFCRGFLELQCSLDLWRHKNKRGEIIRTPRLRLYGQPDILRAVASHLPAAPKKLQSQSTRTGSTCLLAYQSPAEVSAILDFLDAPPQNTALWDRWRDLIAEYNREASIR